MWVRGIGLYLTSSPSGLVNFLTFKSVPHSNLMQFLQSYNAAALAHVYLYPAMVLKSGTE